MDFYQGAERFKKSYSSVVVTIGNFDGVHQGHKKIIQTALLKARERGGAFGVFTFRPHPQLALKPQAELPLLTTYDEKIDLLKKQNPDFIVEEPFSREFSTVSAERFFNEYLLERLGVSAIVIGYDFSFGKGREGHIDKLKRLCFDSKIDLEVVSPVQQDGVIVSSSKIRELIALREISQANRLLGYSFSYTGTVMKGDGRGRTIGYPTANLKMVNKLVLPLGVYATHAFVGGKKYPSITNVGVRPTFISKNTDDQVLPVLVETHLLDQEIDLYGETMRVDFEEALRPEKKFSSIQELVSQIKSDIQQTRQILPN